MIKLFQNFLDFIISGHKCGFRCFSNRGERGKIKKKFQWLCIRAQTVLGRWGNLFQIELVLVLKLAFGSDVLSIP